METQYHSYLTYKDQKLYFLDTKLEEIANKFESPLYLYSQEVLENNFKSFQQAANKISKSTEICFAIKSNSNKKLLSILANLGAGADIVSAGELERALEVGIPASKIVFSGVGKTREEIKRALEENIYSFNVESIEELKLINELAEKMDTTANIAFRLNPQVKAITHKYISTGYKTHKFGILEEDILKSLEDESLWTHTKLKGLSIHIGSQLLNLEATGEAVKLLSECVNKFPFKIEFVDVGGGLGVNYTSKQEVKAPSLDTYMETLSHNLKIDYPVKIVFEPGRCIVASAGVFVAKVLRSKVSADCRFLIVDGGMNDFTRPSLYQAYHEIYPSFESEELFETDIVGPICETADCFGEQRLMPKMNEDDFIVIADTGAYGYSMSSNYNLRSKPREILIETEGSVIEINSLQNLSSI